MYMEKVKRWRDIVMAAIALVLAGFLMLLAGIIVTTIEVTGGLHPVQPSDRGVYAFAVTLAIVVIVLALGIVDLMSSPDRCIDSLDKRDDDQNRGATLEVAIGDDEFASRK